MFNEWIEAKEIERQAIERRRAIEDQLTKQFEIDEQFEGTKTKEVDGYKIKIVARMNRKVDTEALREIAAENEIDVSALFRWSAEIDAKAWKNADQSITDKLACAITTKPSRPSYTIEKELQDE